jgi:hypothetical protein
MEYDPRIPNMTADLKSDHGSKKTGWTFLAEQAEKQTTNVAGYLPTS